MARSIAVARTSAAVATGVGTRKKKKLVVASSPSLETRIALAAEVESLRADKEIVDAVLKYLGYDIVTDIKEGDRLLIDEKNQKSTAIRVIPGSQAAKDASELRLFRSDFECMEWLEEQHAVTLGRTLGTPESPPFRSHLLRIGLPSRSRSFGGESYRAAIDAARTHAQEGGP